MRKLHKLSLAALLLITTAYCGLAQDPDTVAYTTKTKHKDNGRVKHKVIPYEPIQAEYPYPRNIDVFRYNSFYGYYPDNYGYYPYQGYVPFYGYPWHRDEYRNLNRHDNGPENRDRRYWRR